MSFGKLRIFHIFNTAGVASVIAKYMDRLFKTKSKVVTRKIFDKFGLTTYGETWTCGSNEVFALRCLWHAKDYDIIHIHADFDKIIPFLKILYPQKAIVMHYHSSAIRDKWVSNKKYWNKADLVLYSTKDILGKETPDHAIHLTNPVDTDLFHPLPISPKPKTAFHFSYSADDLAIKYAREHGLRLTIHDRKTSPIPHILLPRVLCRYEYYIDVKRNAKGRIARDISKTGLEALACGLKVITWNGKTIKGLPVEHRPENVVRRLYQLYMNLI